MTKTSYQAVLPMKKSWLILPAHLIEITSCGVVVYSSSFLRMSRHSQASQGNHGLASRPLASFGADKPGVTVFGVILTSRSVQTSHLAARGDRHARHGLQQLAAMAVGFPVPKVFSRKNFSGFQSRKGEGPGAVKTFMQR